MPLLYMGIVVEPWEYRENHRSLTRWPDRLPFLGGLEILFEGFLKGWLGERWCAPSLELDMV